MSLSYKLLTSGRIDSFGRYYSIPAEGISMESVFVSFSLKNSGFTKLRELLDQFGSHPFRH